MRGLRARLGEEVDAAGVGAFRALFGALMVFATARFVANGWVEEIYLAPDFHFTYLGFSWVRPLPSPWIYVQFGAMGLAAAMVMVGVATRRAAAVFFVLFTWTELIEKAAYLNHYYFVSLAALLLVAVPSDRALALGGPRGGDPDRGVVPRWVYVLLRAQVGLVYFYAGFAKLNADWLFRAEPLATWLQAYGHWPIIGGLLGQPVVAFAMSWAGAAFDLTIWAWLLWPRTRPWAYAAAVVFHVSVWVLFPIGVFSWVMLVAGTVFFDPSWPRRLVGRLRGCRRAAPPSASAPGGAARGRDAAPVPPLLVAALAGWIGMQAVLPLRHVLYPGPVNWTEEGFRFAWRVMLIEKTGAVEYRVEAADPPSSYRVYPREHLTPLQFRMLSTQPDMVLEYAHRLRDEALAAGHGSVAVYADAWVSFNGRPSQRFVDPDVDLAAERRSLCAASWIVPMSATR